MNRNYGAEGETLFNEEPVCFCGNISKKLCFDCANENPRMIFSYCFYCFINKFKELNPTYDYGFNQCIGLGIIAMKIGKLDKEDGRTMVKLTDKNVSNLKFFYELGYKNPSLI